MLTVVRGFEVYSIDQAYASLHRPDLVREKLAGDPNGKVREAAITLNIGEVVASGAPPEINITSPKAGAAIGADEATIELTLTDRGGGIGKVEWRLNGVTIGVDARSSVSDTKPMVGTVMYRRRTFTLDPGNNRIEVVVYNASNLIASLPAILTVSSPDTRRDPPRLYVLAVGVSDYWDGRLRLNYAAADAHAVADSLARAGKLGLYRDVEIARVIDADVTVSKLNAVFSTLSSKMRPSDVFVFFAAGHGRSRDGRYYFIPQDFRYKDQNSLVDQGIDEDKIQEWMASIPARKSVLIYDTCESGTLTGPTTLAVRGTEQLETDRQLLDRLIRSTGRTILTASRGDDPALEGLSGHGVFTYALLSGLSEADDNRNGVIEISELARYLDNKVPEISRKTFGWRQVPQMKQVGSDFALVKVVANPGWQAPSASSSEIDREPTHVLIAKIAARQSANISSPVVQEIVAGTRVLVITTTGEWSLVARNGRKIGFVPREAIARLQ